MFTCDHQDLESRGEPIKAHITEKFNKQAAREVTFVCMPWVSVCLCRVVLNKAKFCKATFSTLVQAELNKL